MAQLRQDYDAFKARGAEIVVVGPETQEELARHWAAEDLPFIGLADPDHTVSAAYGQKVSLLRMGRMPALVVIDRHGSIQHRRYGESMRDIASSDDVLRVLDEINSDSLHRYDEG